MNLSVKKQCSCLLSKGDSNGEINGDNDGDVAGSAPNLEVQKEDIVVDRLSQSGIRGFPFTFQRFCFRNSI